MKFKLKSMLFLLLMLFSISNVYSAVCCYNQDQGIIPSGTDACEQNDILLGPYEATGGEFEACERYESTRQGCFLNSGACFETVEGREIYNIAEIRNSFNFEAFCDSIDTITDDCGGDWEIEITNGGNDGGGSNDDNDGNDDDGSDSGDTVGGGGDDDGGGSFDTPDDDGFQDTDTPTDTPSFCEDAGDPFGFYVTKESCESINAGSTNSCLYNPYKGGFLTTKYEDREERQIGYFEKACIPKSEIKECFDYKTQLNCEENPSKGISASNKLNDGCRWIDSSVYREGLTVEKTGMCISTIPADNSRYFDRTNYGYRLNLIKDSSFELGGIWQGTDSDNYVDDEYSYDGDTYYTLANGDSISQTVNGLSSRISYAIYLYARTNNIPASNDFVRVTVTPYDFEGNVIDSEVQISTREVSDVVALDEIGAFQRFSFNGFVSKSNMDYVVFEVSNEGSDIDIDAVAFESQSSASVTSPDELYKPVEIITSSASRCELCYDPLNLNLCTESKSNLMGDCSYMTTDVSEEYESSLANYPTDENLFMNDPWISQSLPNSRLFCNMYTNEVQCLGSNSYVNDKFSPVHEVSGSTLCKWDDSIGCFKDSDNNGQQDTQDGALQLRVGLIPLEGESSSDFALACDSLPPVAYLYFTGTNVAGDTVVLSGSSDELVGNVIVNLEAFDASNLESCEGYGLEDKQRLYFDYSVENGGEVRNGAFRSNTNHYKNSLPIRDFFKTKDSSGNTVELIGDDTNDISVRVVDQSGNVGREIDFTFNLDSQGPTIELISPATIGGVVFEQYVGPDTVLEFRITDSSGNIDSCDYTLTPVGFSPPPQEYYTAFGSFDLSQLQSDGTFFFTLPIFNTSINVDTYNLIVTCSDIFGQTDTEGYIFNADFYTQIVVANPRPFTSYLLDHGFLNGPSSFEALSPETSLESCSLDFAGSGLESSDLAISVLPDTYDVPARFGDKEFNTLITQTLNFNFDGFKEGQIVCSDTLGNEHRKTLRYYYDTVDPVALNYDLAETSVGSSPKIIEHNGRFYTYTESPGEFTVTLDGTGTWIARSANLRYNDGSIDSTLPPTNGNSDGGSGSPPSLPSLPPSPNSQTSGTTDDEDSGPPLPPAPPIPGSNDNANAENVPAPPPPPPSPIAETEDETSSLGVPPPPPPPNPSGGGNSNSNDETNGEIVGGVSGQDATVTFQYDIVEESFIGAIKFAPPLDRTVYNGIPIEGEIGLSEIRYNLEFFDSAGNVGNTDVSYFLDSSDPEIIVGGNDFNQVGDKIFANTQNPRFDVTFNAPSYRTYTCEVRIQDGTFTFVDTFGPSSNINFLLSELTSNVVLTENKVLRVSFDCVDIYGFQLTKSFDMYYDVTPPELNGMYLDGGNEKFFKNWENQIFGDINDRLVFDLVDTNEPAGVTCNYRFAPRNTNVYDCSAEQYSSTFSAAGPQLTGIFNLLGSNDGSPVNPICLRNSLFDIAQLNSIGLNADLETQVRIEGWCTDSAGLETSRAFIDVQIDYVQGDLVSFELDVLNKKVFPTVKSLVPFSRIAISLTGTTDRIILDLTSNGQDSNGLFEYISSVGIPLTDLGDGDVTLFALGLDASDNIISQLTAELYVDTKAPAVNLEIPDEFDGEIFTDEFFVLFDALDEGSDLEYVELYVNNVLVFDSNNLSFFDPRFVREHDAAVNRPTNGLRGYDGRVISNVSAIDQSYTFRLVASDVNNNINETSKTVTLRDGIAIILEDSLNSIVDPSGLTWATSTQAPILNFRSSRQVTFCEIYPMIDEGWIDATGNSGIGSTRLPAIGDNSNRNTDSFSFDLSSIGSYDLEALDDTDSLVRILCEYEGNFYQFHREVKYVNYLPDYVLLSSEGFVFNEDPYTTDITVKSVGPYRYVTCTYDIDGGSPVLMEGGPGVEFRDSLDFSLLSAGEHEINLQCVDALGNTGPDKSYKFVVNRDDSIDITDVRLTYGNSVFEESGGEIYISSLADLKLNFNVNKKNTVTCNYRINPAGNFLSGFLNFFRNLFEFGKKDMSSAQAFEFEASGLNFEDGTNQLIVACNSNVSSAFSENVYDVIYQNRDIEIDLIRTGR